MLTIEVTSVSVASFPSPSRKETNISYPLATPSHCMLYVRSSRMSELSRFVYMESHVTLHVKASAQKVWYFQRHNSFSEHPKNQVFFPLQR